MEALLALLAPAQGAQIYQKVPYWHFWHLAPSNLRFFEKVPYGTSKSKFFVKSAKMALLALFIVNCDGTSKPANFSKSAKMALLALLAPGTFEVKIEVEVPASSPPSYIL